MPTQRNKSINAPFNVIDRSITSRIPLLSGKKP
jgi:hypothetical protein